MRTRGGSAVALLAAAVLLLSACGTQARAAQVQFRINQLGYAPGAPVRVFALARGHPASRLFIVRDDHGRVVRRGHARGPLRWNARYGVYTLDLLRLGAPGRYTISFAGARSPALRVAAAASLYRPLAAGAVAFFQSQRDGPETIAGLLQRVPSHLRDANAAVYAQPSYRGTTLQGNLTPTGVRVDASGGWFDAGDYLKFVQTASFSDVLLLYTLRSFPTGVANRPALEAEARFGTDWLLKMWDQTRRVLYYQVGIGDGNEREGRGAILGDHDLWRLGQADDTRNPAPGSPAYYTAYRPVFAANAPGAPISPNLAGRVAAAFGLCAQVFAQSDPAYARRCLVAGQTIYDQADTRPHGPLLTASPHAYYSEVEWRDDMQLGATELYLATQQALGLSATSPPAAPAVEAGGVAPGAAPPPAAAGLPHTDLGYYLTRAGVWANAYIVARGSGADSLNLYDVSTLADRDLIGVLQSPLGQSLVAGEEGVQVPASPASLLKDRRDQLRLASRLARQEPFGLANPSTNLDTVAHALGYAIQARTYDEAARTSTFERLSQQQLAWVLGANAWGSSFVVGAGSLYPHCLAAQIANLAGSLTGAGAIERGATVNGPTAPGNLRGLELPEGARRCTAGATRFAALDGHRLAYRDDVRASMSSEPSDDLAALTLLASAQQAAAG
jgi:endoglucanase